MTFAAVLVHEGLELRGFALGHGQGRAPRAGREAGDAGRRLGHVLLEDVIGVRLVAEEVGPPDAEGGDLGRDGLVVGLVRRCRRG